MAPLSLKRQFTRYTTLPFILVGLLLVAVIVGSDYAARQAQIKEMLDQRALAIKMNFSAYLDRAEFEAMYLTQHIDAGGSLDSLFQLHDVLFSGGLDFFYVRLTDGSDMVDPRSRLYTLDSLEQLVSKSRTNLWSHTTTSEGGELLIFKMILPIDNEGRAKGYMYGFISLDNNLALSSDVLSGADVDAMRLQDLAGNTLLKDQLPSLSEDVATVVHTSIFTLPALLDKFSLELRVAQPLSIIASQWLLIVVSAVISGIVLLYWIAQYYAKKWMFQPLTVLPAMQQEEGARYLEFEPLIAQMNRYQSQLKAREQHLQLLLDSLHSAILFCDESARVTAINHEAKTIFPDYGVAKTIFDITPLAFHQPVQSALKGDFGGRFEYEFEGINKIYEWFTYSYVNEYGFRGVMIVGRDVTELRRLSWHLDSLHPNNTIDRPRPEPEILLREMSLLEDDSDEAIGIAPDRWLLVISRILSGVSKQVQYSSAAKPLGEFLIEQLNEVEHGLALAPEQLAEVELAIPLEMALCCAYWNSDHKWLIQVALLLCLNGRISGRRISIDWQGDKLKLAVQGVSAPTHILAWLLEALPNLVKGRVIYENSGRIVFTSTIEVVKAKDDRIPLNGKVVSLIENDLSSVQQIRGLLSSLNIEVDVFGSFDEFFRSSRALLAPYDGVLVGMGNKEKGFTGVARLSAMFPERERLPVMYIGNLSCQDSYPTLPLSHLFSYGMAKALYGVFNVSELDLGERVNCESHWFLAGGNSLMQTVWQAELNAVGIMARKECNIDQLEEVFQYGQQMVVLILDKQTAQHIIKQKVFVESQTRWVTTEDFSERPESMCYFDLGAMLPDPDQVADLCRLMNV